MTTSASTTRTTTTASAPLHPAGVTARARAVTKTYGAGDAQVHALRQVDIDIPVGRFTAIMGPSGSGKSTLLHVLAGLDRVTSGTVHVAGRELTAMDDEELTLFRRDHIGFIFQSFNLLPNLTAAENIALPTRIAGVTPDPLWVQSVIRIVGLTERLRHRHTELSGPVRDDLDADHPEFSTAVARDVAAVDGVRTVSAAGYEMARVNAETAPVASVDPSTVTAALDPDVVEGSMGVLERGELMLSAPAAEASGLGVGDHVDVAFTSGKTHAFTTGGIFERQQFLGADYLLSNRQLDRFVPNRLDSKVLVVADDGTEVRDVEQRLDVLLRDRPDATVMDKEKFQGEMSGIVNQLLTVVTVLLLLAVVIALLGIVNTLALSVFERTRELGLLRAVGMTRRQIRAMVRWESVMIAGMGTVLGAGLGVGLGVTLVRALADDGLDRLAVPVGQLLGYVAAAAVAGVLAAIGPARRAAKVDVLKAVVAD